jgi:hypothetical protein
MEYFPYREFAVGDGRSEPRACRDVSFPLFAVHPFSSEGDFAIAKPSRVRSYWAF